MGASAAGQELQRLPQRLAGEDHHRDELQRGADFTKAAKYTVVATNGTGSSPVSSALTYTPVLPGVPTNVVAIQPTRVLGSASLLRTRWALVA